jgi:hypothetical protein
LANLAIGGWRMAGIFTLTSGRPFTVYSGSNTSSNVVNSLADCNGCSRSDGGAFLDPTQGFIFFFNDAERARFSIPAPGSIGNTARNFFTGPRFVNLDFSLAKNLEFTERLNMELRADVTNLTNTVSFSFPTATYTSTTFGRIRDSVVSASRRIQIGARFTF